MFPSVLSSSVMLFNSEQPPVSFVYYMSVAFVFVTNIFAAIYIVSLLRTFCK